jgi:hypothetical protein
MATAKRLGTVLLLASLLPWLGITLPPSPPLVTPALAQGPPLRRVNAPYFSGKVNLGPSAIFWFGQVNSTDNYTDVRVGYNDEHLRININTFDRYLWYDTSPGSDLNEWDAATLYLDLNGDGGDVLTGGNYRFVAQINWWEPRTNYQMAFQGDGGEWAPSSIPFTTNSAWRGSDLNNNDSGHDDRGWTLDFYIPFASLGLSGPPADGTTWGLAVVLHDRDTEIGSPRIPDKSWPEATQDTQPATWGELVFNPPPYQSPPAIVTGATTIRHKLHGVVVTDAAVGGGSTCGQGLDYWTEWGEANYAGKSDFNIQNQGNVDDWPCFSKYYVTFPTDALPSGKVIISATLTLHQFGNAGEPGEANPSLIQVFTLAEDWDEATLTWNNAPLAMENVAATRVDPLTSGVDWPGVPREWDITGATAAAYAAGVPLRLALYEADYYTNSGKYFVSSDTGDWNAEGRPTLSVIWGQPPAALNKQVRPAKVTNGDILTYTLSWLGTGQPLAMVDTLPNGLSQPGPINASDGNAAYDPGARQVVWMGNPTTGQAVTVTFPVTVEVDGPLALHNTAVLTAGGGIASTASATTLVDPLCVYLPLVFK